MTRLNRQERPSCGVLWGSVVLHEALPDLEAAEEAEQHRRMNGETTLRILERSLSDCAAWLLRTEMLSSAWFNTIRMRRFFMLTHLMSIAPGRNLAATFTDLRCQTMTTKS